MNHKRRVALFALSLLLAAFLNAKAFPGDASFRLVGTFSLPNDQIISAFDISTVDARTGIYAFSDRTNASVDVFALNDNETVDGAPNPNFPNQISLLVQVPGFNGLAGGTPTTYDHDIAGPDGLVIVNHSEIWAGDCHGCSDTETSGHSTINVINIASRQITDVVNTGGVRRTDEGAYDPFDQIVLMANDAETDVAGNFNFISLISALPDEGGTHKILKRITLNGSTGVNSEGEPVHIPNATNGIEASQYDAATGMFYLNLPQKGETENVGATVVINPKTLTVEKVFNIFGCQPAGMALGLNNEALLGCSQTNNAASKNLPAQVISLTTGQTLATYPEIKGNDEVWFDPGDDRYFAAEQTNVPTSLGIINAETLEFKQNITTVTGAHSVAADPISNRVFVPLGGGPGSGNTICPNGCIGIYSSSD